MKGTIGSKPIVLHVYIGLFGPASAQTLNLL